MNREFVPYNIALALKKLGFDELCLGYYINQDKFRFAKPSIDGKFIPFYNKNSEAIKYLRCFMIIGKKKDTICTAPSYHQAFRWFREKYNLHATFDVNSFNIGKWKYKIESLDKSIILEHGCDQEYWTMGGFLTSYEEIELACLEKLISIVKEKKHEKV